MKARVHCFSDGGRLRVKPDVNQPGVDDKLFVAFPKDRRVLGARYECELTLVAKGTHYTARDIVRVHKVNVPLADVVPDIWDRGSVGGLAAVDAKLAMRATSKATRTTRLLDGEGPAPVVDKGVAAAVDDDIEKMMNEALGRGSFS